MEHLELGMIKEIPYTGCSKMIYGKVKIHIPGTNRDIRDEIKTALQRKVVSFFRDPYPLSTAWILKGTGDP